MKTELFDFSLPDDRIAQLPLPERDAARMLVLPREGGPVDDVVRGLPPRVAPGTLVVVNDTRVRRCRVLGTKPTGGKVELFFLGRVTRPDAPDPGPGRELWRALGRASKGLGPGTEVDAGPVRARIVGRDAEALEVEVTSTTGASVAAALEAAGRVPLPPYVRRDPTPEDELRYQTVFAERPGAVAAPTAGLHLSAALLEALAARDVEIARCTLHVGVGTFKPVATDDLDDHPMHAEELEVGDALVDAVARARARGAAVLAVGTTSLRALESAACPERVGHVRALAGATRLFVQPGYRFRVVDRLFTNFHLPRSTLLALVSAFAGRTRVLDAYAHAVREGYRFYSYGDAMLLDRRDDDDDDDAKEDLVRGAGAARP